jgi:hypothetical protein
VSLLIAYAQLLRAHGARARDEVAAPQVGEPEIATVLRRREAARGRISIYRETALPVDREAT